MLTSNQIADYFIELSNPGTKRNITNLKLQKLLYYAQGTYLAQAKDQNISLFAESIRAWKHGPVVAEVYRRFSQYGFNEIDKAEIESNSIKKIHEKEMDTLLDKVWDNYGHYNGKQLERMTHLEEPWLKTRDGLPSYVSSNKEIPIEVIKEYFIKQE